MNRGKAGKINDWNELRYMAYHILGYDYKDINGLVAGRDHRI
ncbi:hypothetical protein SAMN04488542_1353 [Fontibacillus panacisegetis]|uniref:Uncharacterized protein n=1 Tax=Fontibacillus panacisegetis TaxID=670482 RepID=A0A1G7T7H0_9BACL|nr:hypothetical protein SAMN04488542_1353 [Fontibacillus panacisegetis]